MSKSHRGLTVGEIEDAGLMPRIAIDGITSDASRTALANGCAIAYRTIRENVYQALTSADPITQAQAQAVIDAVVPLARAVTGRTREQILGATLRRLERDGVIEIRQVAGSTVIVAKQSS